MLGYIFLQILAILSIGDFTSNLLKLNENHYSNKNILRLVNAISLGYASIVIPVVLVGLLTEGKLAYVFYIHFSLGMIFFIYLLMRLFSYLHQIQLNEYYYLMKQNLILIAISIFVVGYLFISLLYPVRGWDVLHFYLPNAFYFYSVDDLVSGFNPLSFYPTFKPPVNTIYLMYGYYISKDFSAQLHPFVFLIGTMFLVIEFLNKENDKDLTITTAFIFIAMPFTYLLIYEYAFYQELPLLFYFSLSMLKFINLEEQISNQEILNIGLILTMTILCKISGYSVFIILLFSIPLTGKINRLRQLLTIIIVIFLLRKAIFDIYYLMGVPIVLIGIYLLYAQNQFTKSEVINLVKRNKRLLLIFLFPFSFGILWVRFMLNIPGIQEYLKTTYFEVQANKLRYVFSSANPSTIFFENGVSVSFLGSTTYLILGSVFGVLGIFFIIGFINSNNYKMKLWLLGFWIVWYSIFGNVSIRYLVPLLVPYSFFVAQGFSRFKEKMELSDQIFSLFIILLTISSYSGLIPIFPIRYFVQNPNLRFFNYHNNLLISLFSILLLLLILTKLTLKIKLEAKNTNMVVVIIIILCLLPFAPQLGTFTYHNFDQEQTQSTLNYYHRDNYQNLIDFFNEIKIPIEHKIISYNTPGLEIFILRSVFDIMMPLTSDGDIPIEFLSNVSRIQESIEEYSFYYLIGLNSSHVDYSNFINLKNRTVIFDMVHNSTYYELMFYNSEFVVYEYQS